MAGGVPRSFAAWSTGARPGLVGPGAGVSHLFSRGLRLRGREGFVVANVLSDPAWQYPSARGGYGFDDPVGGLGLGAVVMEGPAVRSRPTGAFPRTTWPMPASSGSSTRSASAASRSPSFRGWWRPIQRQYVVVFWRLRAGGVQEDRARSAARERGRGPVQSGRFGGSGVRRGLLDLERRRRLRASCPRSKSVP